VDGKFIRKIGREGKGPGEFQYINGIVVGPHDTVYVFDRNLLRMTVIDPTGAVVRTFAAPSTYMAIAVTKNGALLGLNSLVVGKCYHVLTPEGSVKREFGDCGLKDDKGGIEMAAASPLARTIGADASSGFWSGYVHRYEIEGWRLDGTVTDTLVRNVDWFKPRVELVRPAPTEPRPPTLKRVLSLPDGTLLTMIERAAPDWEAGKLDATGKRIRGTWDKAKYQTMLEVLDPKTGGLLAARQLTWLAAGLIGDGIILQSVEDADGNATYDIFRISLKGKR
jgi:hypothetical protein